MTLERDETKRDVKRSAESLDLSGISTAGDAVDAFSDMTMPPMSPSIKEREPNSLRVPNQKMGMALAAMQAAMLALEAVMLECSSG